MAKAIMGAYGDARTVALLDEVRALRARVEALESALKNAERAADRAATDGVEVVELDRPAEHELDAAGSVSV